MFTLTLSEVTKPFGLILILEFFDFVCFVERCLSLVMLFTSCFGVVCQPAFNKLLLNLDPNVANSRDSS